MPGVGSAEDVSLYRSELVAIHFGSKTRPAPAGKRGTEICLPHNFEVDSSGRTTMLGKPATPGLNRYGIVWNRFVIFVFYIIGRFMRAHMRNLITYKRADCAYICAHRFLLLLITIFTALPCLTPRAVQRLG